MYIRKINKLVLGTEILQLVYVNPFSMKEAESLESEQQRKSAQIHSVISMALSLRLSNILRPRDSASAERYVSNFSREIYVC
jgi:hypothetical protein